MPQSRHLDQKAAQEWNIAKVSSPESALPTEMGEFEPIEAHLNGVAAQLLSQVSDAIVAIDIKGSVTYWNQAAEQLYEVRASEIRGQPLDIAYAHRWPSVEARQAADDALAIAGAWCGEAIHIKNSGEEIIVELSISRLKDERGNTIGLVSVNRKISDRRRNPTKTNPVWFPDQPLEAECASETLTSAADSHFFTLSVDMLCIIGLDGCFKRLNPATEKTLGYSVEELTNQPFLTLVHPEDQAATLAAVPALATSNPTISLENRYHCKDGSYKWLSWKGVLVVEEGLIYAIARDITKPKQTEAALHHRKREWKALVENTPDIIIRCNREGRYLYVNPAIERVTGQPAKFFIGKTSEELGNPEALCQLWNTTLAKVFETAQQQTIEFQAPSVEGLRDYQSRVVPELDYEEGTIQSALIVIRDITGLRQAERERTQLIYEKIARTQAETAQQRLAFLAQASDILASSLDYETTLERVAQLAVSFLADWCVVHLLDQNQLLRQVAVAHLDPTKVQLAQELRRRYPIDPNAPYGAPNVMRTGQSEIVAEIPDSMLVTAAKDAELLQILRQLGLKSYMTVPLVARSRLLGTITFVSAESGRRYNREDLALAQDLAHRAALAVDNARLYSASQKANRIKDDFLAIISHEFRTPLNSVLGWAQLLRVRKFDATATVLALETIERNAKTQLKLVDDILEFSQMVGGNLYLKLRPVNLALAIYGAMNAHRPAAEAKGIELVSNLEEMELKVFGDRDRLQQVVWHLLSNAIKFTPARGRIEVRLAKLQSAECRVQLGKGNTSSELFNPQAEISYAQIQVMDTGKGIDPEFLPHVFDYFRQGESATTRSQGGLGLGLALVRRLIELHGGTVDAASQGEGQGATFTVQLPLLC